MNERESLFASSFWAVVLVTSWVSAAFTVILTVIVLTRPHAGHRGPPHWEAATILLSVTGGSLLVSIVAWFTLTALAEGPS